MKYCARCLYPANHPLGLTFSDEGICSGCLVHEEKDTLDWGMRRARLERLVSEFRSTSPGAYDCVVPVSGARDSFFIVHTLKNELGLNPLLVTYNRHHNTRIGIRNISYLRTLLDCDILTLTLKPELIRAITRETLRLRGSIYWHVLAGQTVFPVRIAVGYKIPLIIWGSHQGLDQVGMFSHQDEVEMTRKYRHEHDLMGLEAEDLAAQSHIPITELATLCYPRDEEISPVWLLRIYLGNYLRWDTKAQHEAMLTRYQYEVAPQQRTFDTYSDVDCLHYSGLHDYIKYLKLGYGKATDHACREIRLRRLTREEGVALVSRYEEVRPADTTAMCNFLGMTEDELFEQADRFRDPAIWEQRSDGRWTRKDCVSRSHDAVAVDRARLARKEECTFYMNSASELSAQLLTRGYVDDTTRAAGPLVPATPVHVAPPPRRG